MSLLDKANLLITANAVKAGKLYSVIPNTAALDATVVRNTTATRVNSAGIVVSSPVNTARISYLTIGGEGFILDEPQRTNLVKDSSNLKSSNWNKGQSGVTVVNSSVLSPNNVDFSELLNVNVSSGNIFTRQQIYSSTTLNTSHSVFVKKLNTRYLAIRNSGASGLHDVFDFDTETFTNRASNNLSFESLPNGWYRIKSIKTSTLGNFFISFFPAIDDSGNETISTAINVGVYIWGAQGEIADTVSSHIPTTSAAVTRNADVITVAPPAGTVKITTTFSNNTTQVLTTIPATFTVPEGLIKQVLMQSSL